MRNFLFISNYSLVSILLLFTFSCSTKKGPYTYEVCVIEKADSSFILKNEVLGIADTTIAFFYGRILDIESKEPIAYANVILTNTKEELIYGQITDSLGNYSISAIATDYEFSVKCVGYTSFKKNIIFSTGEIRLIKVGLGYGSRYVTYEVQGNEKLSRKQYKKRRQELENE